jgi:hypothetical protein
MANIICVLYPDPENGYPPNMHGRLFRLLVVMPMVSPPKGTLGFKSGELVGSCPSINRHLDRHA